MPHRYFLGLACALLGWLLPLPALWAQPAALSVTQQEQDFRIFRQGLQEGHGGLNYFIDKKRFDQQCDSVGRTFRRHASPGDFYLKLRYLLALLGHGHSRLNLPVRNPDYKLGLLQPDRRYLPLELRILRGRLYVLTDCSAEQTVTAGAEIRAINGVPAATLIAQMVKYIPADGRNVTFKHYNLTTYYAFHFLYHLLYPQTSDFALTLTGTRRPVRVQGQLPAILAHTYQARTGRSISYYGEQLAYQPTRAPGVAYLRVSSFYKGLLERNGRRFEPFIDSVFQDVKTRGTHTVVLDLRGNEGGGDGYAEYLFAHLTDQPFASAVLDRVASRRLSTLAYAHNLSEDVRAFAADPNQFLADDTTLVLKPQFREDLAPKPDPARPSYLGPLYVLTNGGTFSAGNSLVSYLYRQRQTTGRVVWFVGEENGGDIYSNVLCAGQGYSIKLPNSLIEVDMPFLCGGQLNRTPPPKRLPDHDVQPTIKQVLKGQDAEVEFVLRRIRKR
ncbi:S41 family peptidase [Hymenobacter tenuis]